MTFRALSVSTAPNFRLQNPCPSNLFLAPECRRCVSLFSVTMWPNSFTKTNGSSGARSYPFQSLGSKKLLVKWSNAPNNLQKVSEQTADFHHSCCLSSSCSDLLLLVVKLQSAKQQNRAFFCTQVCCSESTSSAKQSFSCQLPL